MKRFFVIFGLVLLSACSQPATPEPKLGEALPVPEQSKTATFVPGEVIVKFRPGFAAQSLSVARQRLERVRSLGAADAPAQLYRMGEASEKQTRDLIAALAARSDVLYAHPNYLLSATATPNDTFYAYQWHYSAINLPAAWDKTKGSSSVRVAVIDTGILRAHPDLSSKLVAGYDFISDPVYSNDGNGRDSNPEDPSGSYHGSHVAGTIAAATNNGLGVAGVSWLSRVVPVRVLGPYGGTLADIIDGMLWSAGRSVSGVPANANPAQVLNMSLGGEFACSGAPALQEAINQINAAGATIVVAAGNENQDARNVSPASCSGVITVGATDFLNRRAGYSNYGPRIDVMAPGGDMTADANSDGYADGVLSTIWDDYYSEYSYSFFEGTSMAAPHVAGVVALMKSVSPSLTRTQILDVLKQTARPITHASCSVGCGAGLIDAAGSVSGNPPTDPATYVGNFGPTAPVGRVISTISRGRGIASSTGQITGTVGVFALRKGKTGNMAMVTGAARHLIIARAASSQISNAAGGLIDIKFANFGTGKVNFKTLRVKNTTTTNGKIRVYRGSSLVKTVTVPRTGAAANRVITLNVTNATRVSVNLTGPGAIDDLVFVGLN